MIIKRENIFVILTMIIGLAAAARPAAAQVMPDDIFDNCPEAFGDTLNDVPPDIHSVEITPAAPAPGETVTVRAQIMTDKWLTVYKVENAVLTYIAGEAAAPVDVEMKLAEPGNWIWEAQIPGQPEGTVVKYGITAHDGTGNAVVQLIETAGFEPGRFTDVLADKENKDIEGSLDLLGLAMMSDGENYYYCEEFRTQFKWATFRGAAITGVGFYPQDVRVIPAHSITENTNAFIGYVPAIGIKSIIGLNNLKNITQGIPVSIKVKGNKVCGRTKISDLTDKPERGLKMFAATAAYDFNGTGKLNLSDSTPYAIVYFKANKYIVK